MKDQLNNANVTKAQPAASTAEIDDDDDGVRRVRGRGAPPPIPTLGEALLAVPRRGTWRDPDA